MFHFWSVYWHTIDIQIQSLNYSVSDSVQNLPFHSATVENAFLIVVRDLFIVLSFEDSEGVKIVLRFSVKFSDYVWIVNFEKS